MMAESVAKNFQLLFDYVYDDARYIFYAFVFLTLFNFCRCLSTLSSLNLLLKSSATTNHELLSQLSTFSS